MTAPVNLSALALLDVAAAEILAAPALHLAASTDPALRFGRLSLSAGVSASSTASFFLILEKGSLTLASGDNLLRISAGQAVQIGPETDVTLIPGDGAEVLLLAHLSAAFPSGIRAIDLEAALSPSPSPSAAVLTTDSPSCSSHPMPGAGPVTLGLWAATPYARKAVTMAYSEVMYFLDGGATLIDDQGIRHSFGPGEVLLAPVGASLGWESSLSVRKLFISADPV